MTLDEIKALDDEALRRAIAEQLPKGEALFAYWIGLLDKCERSILEYLFKSYPKYKSKEEISDATGYSVTSSGFNNSLSSLRTLELIQGRGDIRISEVFFE